MTTTPPPPPVKNKPTAREMLAAREARFLAGADPAEYPELVQELREADETVRAVDRAHGLFAKGRAERRQAKAEAELLHDRQTAIHDAQELLRECPEILNDAANRAVMALRLLFDAAEAYGKSYAEAVQLLAKARVPYLTSNPDNNGATVSGGEWSGVLDHDNHANGDPYDPGSIVIAGQLHIKRSLDPGSWVRAAIYEAAQQRGGMPTRSISGVSGPIDRAIGNVKRPELPSVDPNWTLGD